MANLRANKIVGIGSTDAGLTFNGPISLNTQGYMYFPTGDTIQRGRGRGLLMGGAVSPGSTNTNIIKYFLSFNNPLLGFKFGPKPNNLNPIAPNAWLIRNVFFII